MIALARSDQSRSSNARADAARLRATVWPGSCVPCFLFTLWAADQLDRLADDLDRRWDFLDD